MANMSAATNIKYVGKFVDLFALNTWLRCLPARLSSRVSI